MNIAVLASGRGTNLQALIDATEAGKISARIVLVVSDVESAYALQRAARHGIETRVLRPKEFPDRVRFEEEMVRVLRSRQVGLICLAGFMRILGSTVIENFRGRIMNIHPALLPSFPGLHGQRQALEYGVKISGCTVHFVDEGVDTGPIIIQAAVPVFSGDTEESLSSRILEQEHRIYPLAVQAFVEGRLKIEGRRVHFRGEESSRSGEVVLSPVPQQP
ncbi:MAG: phosphoribosylglycinamide formyltransferase [Candidatus Tectomicrobia bacterium]|uniref:Phosphoribosylglycinamide formyltransferase n=1 Tax=Tectimicrobiota bacterium TaxID=2528274 RepID=A0A932GND4_UNCTE|nr:phosphoribosylglycinamide formyltransferase [Candidatus Tectomicrobia bacterium]